MKQNIDVSRTYKRKKLPNFVYSAHRYTSYSRMLLENFLRTYLGERYFSLRKSLFLFCMLACWPLVMKWNLFSLLWSFFWTFGDIVVNPMSVARFWMTYGSWYAFLCAFLYFSIKRKRETYVDLDLSTTIRGFVHPLFYRLTFRGKPLPPRTIEIYCEPAVFLIAGYILHKMDQSLGLLLILSSVGYSISYWCGYAIATHDSMDRHDKMKHNELILHEIEGDLNGAADYKSVVQGKDPRTALDEIEDVL